MVWPNAPLALVAVEVRFPGVPGQPLRVPVLKAVREALGAGWVLEGAKQQTLEVTFGTGMASPSQNVKVEDLTRLTVRDRSISVTIRPDSLSIEVTRYEGYEPFRELLTSAFGAVAKVIAPDGITRLGMRYIDEIRVPDLSGPQEWREWLGAKLIAPAIDGLVPSAWSSVVQYTTGPDRLLVLRYGPADGPVVSPGPPLKRPRAWPPGPVFVLDFDSFWQPTDIPAFDPPSLLDACDELREPARQLFDQLVTPRLVEEVFAREPD